ncbi:uncharacterized protein LOC110717297 [Chenopodium quinoa]|uniref:uncharacterized protein LOC110717297 n=1 Tax=Chenopodium quinoa TaxID=63459 RepID=UPI000B783304|nr:uncharacterized protein LOC110717297 [Chenopodium quinoa]
MTVSDKKFNEMKTHSEMLETQITQLANTLKESASPTSLPSQGIEPKKPVYSITTRSGKVLEESVSGKSKEVEKVSDSLDEDEHDVSNKKCEDANEKVKIEEIPYEILSGKRERNEVESVKVGECCSALIHNDLPKKIKDPGNFSIPCNINGKVFQNALCDLGASVIIMPYSVFKKLKLSELLPNNMTLQLGDSSIKFPKGRIEDVPLKIGEFTIPVDFTMLEIAEDDNIPIILGRPFLETSSALIDVKGGITTLCVGNYSASFKLKPMHESLSFVQGIMCINSLHLNGIPCTLSLSTNDFVGACDNASITYDNKLVSDGEKINVEGGYPLAAAFEQLPAAGTAKGEVGLLEDPLVAAAEQLPATTAGIAPLWPVLL